MQFLISHCQAISVHFQEHNKSAVWLFPVFQNEIIHFLAVEICSIIEQELHEAQCYTLLADKSKDINKREQFSGTFSYIHNLLFSRKFVGLTLASELNA